MFNKDPIVYANPHPDEQDYGYIPVHPSNQKNASLRNRSPGGNLTQSRQSQEPSSSALDINAEADYHPQRAQMRF